MSKAVLYMSMSVDGFVAGANEGPDNGLGDDGHRLHEWFLPSDAADHKGAAEPLSGVNRQVVDEFMATGAVVVGRRTFEYAGGWGGDHHDGVPIFVLSRRPPSADLTWENVTYVNDVTAAMGMAKDAAGTKDVLVHGALTARLALTAGALDEMELHVVPVLLGQGNRLFENLPPDHIELELIRDLDGDRVQHLRYRVRSEGLSR
jgi:dihydrofolate reductase